MTVGVNLFSLLNSNGKHFKAKSDRTTGVNPLLMLYSVDKHFQLFFAGKHLNAGYLGLVWHTHWLSQRTNL